ncbi:hypothetical protein L6164_034206 [Bauhinia variegata]|uniref:Uncharacterized protein n=1 Tax=Bauhinia variegata TaxID=167791 RepID=A0ACB9KUM9_BAUVA|nr:hypothetical protein L6164_034206 [Bauhinia variegata]
MNIIGGGGNGGSTSGRTRSTRLTTIINKIDLNPNILSINFFNKITKMLVDLTNSPAQIADPLLPLYPGCDARREALGENFKGVKEKTRDFCSEMAKEMR